MKYCSPWKLCTFDIDRAAEFTGDDVDQYSKLVDLEDNYKYLAVYQPAIDSATITPYVQRDGDIATVPVITHFWHDNNADTDIPQATVAGTTAMFLTFDIGMNAYIRLKASGNQTTDRSFYVRGFN